jgi:integrase
MASQQTVPGGVDRHTFHKTRHRGFTYRLAADGSKVFYGFVPGKGRVKLQATAEREARAEWDEIRGKASKGETLPDRKARFAEVAEAWFASKTKLRRSTHDLYRSALDNYLLPRFGVWKLAAIDTDSIAKLIRDMEAKGLSQSTIENYLCPLKGTLDLAVRRGLIPANPYLLLTADERPSTVEHDEASEEGEGAYEWSDEEITGLLIASERLARQPEARFDYSALLRVAVRTGLRLGELLGLQWQHVDLDAGVIHVRQQWTKYGEATPPKTKKGRRRVPLAADDGKFLKRLKLKALERGLASPESFVFSSRAGSALGHRNVQRRGFEAARDEAGLPEHLTFHSLRHAFASYAAHRGVPISVLSEVMGHSHVGVTQKVYVHLYGREQAEDAFRAAMSAARGR